MPCTECRQIFQAELKPLDWMEAGEGFDATYAVAKPYMAVQDTEKNGCYICRVIVRKWESSHPTEQDVAPNELNLNYALRIYPADGHQSHLNVTLRGRNQILGTVGIRFQKAVPDDHDIKGGSTGSREAWTFIKRQLQICNDSHNVCRSLRSDSPWHPTRMIEVSPPGAAYDQVRLVISAEDGVSGQFASLSHCWGGSDILNLLEDNLDSFRSEILLSEMPKTFVDAIVVARTLSIPYIWIDSLCIVQDCADDWQREAVTMMNVYRNAYLNIAATSAANSFGGLFHKRHPESLDEKPVELSIGPLQGAYRFVDANYYVRMVEDAPLNGRAWVLQERLLSWRTIHFATEQVIWDCDTTTACESFPHGVPIWRPSWHDGSAIFRQKGLSLLSEEDIDKGIKQWSDIVSAYTRTNITYEKDRLIAIAGVTEHMESVLGVQYCAGLWRKYLEIHLAWKPEQEAPLPSPAAVRRVPSWSWLKARFGISYPDLLDYRHEGDINFLASAENVELQQHSTLDDGIVVTGHITLRCVLNRVTLRKGDRLEMPGNPAFERDFFKRVDWDFSSGRSKNDEFFVIGLFELVGPGYTNKYSEIRGIVLKERRDANGSPEFERCGHVFWCANSKSKESDDFPEDYSRLQSMSGKENYPCDEHNESGHLIELI